MATGMNQRFSGIGMTSQRTRARMVERLRAQGIADEVVLTAMNDVPRHLFVDEALASRAYEDISLPIGFGQTISQPYIVARMIELARGGRMLVNALEIGTGCGYQAAVLARVAKVVHSVERIAPLIAKARKHLREIRINNVKVKIRRWHFRRRRICAL
jgi:protein-L-isoaspartate(D-aspartate) O-methyltransferase